MKIHPVGAQSFCVDSEMSKLKVAFHKFANPPKNEKLAKIQSTFAK